MAGKEKNQMSDEAKMLAELGCVPMTSEALSRMSLNPYDQLFICRLMSMRDAAAKDEMYTAVAEIVIAQNKRMFDALEDQTKLMRGMSLDISSIKDRLAADELALKLITERLDAKKQRLEAVEGEIQCIKKKVQTIERQVKGIQKKM